MYLTVKPGVRVGGVLGSMGAGRWAGRCQRACEADGRTAGSLPSPGTVNKTAVMMTAYTHMCMHWYASEWGLSVARSQEAQEGVLSVSELFICNAISRKK